jgi:hypothetical protein
MKLAKTKTLCSTLLVVLLSLLSIASCSFVVNTNPDVKNTPPAPASGMIKGSGQIITRQMDLTNFDRVEASSAFTVEIVQSDTYSVAITADDNLFDYIQVSIEDRSLRLQLKKGSYGSATYRAKVSIPKLAGIKLWQASKATVSGVKTSESLDLDISEASMLNGRLEASEAQIIMAGASQLSLQGTCGNLTLKATGASRAQLDQLVLTNAVINLSGASQGSININGRLDASLDAAARLEYSGNPVLGTINSAAAATLIRK